MKFPAVSTNVVVIFFELSQEVAVKRLGELLRPVTDGSMMIGGGTVGEESFSVSPLPLRGK